MGFTWKPRSRIRPAWDTTTAQLKADLERPGDYFKHRIKFIKNPKSKLFTTLNIDFEDFYLTMISEVLNICDNWCDDAELYMQTQHKWHNRTRKAEEGLGAMIAGVRNDKIVLYIYHSVPYGIVLETHTFPKAGFLGILKDTLQVYTPELEEEMQGLIDGM